MSDFTTHNLHKARKQHHCDVCPDPIVVGEHYVRSAGCYEGGMWSGRTHPGCEWLRAAANRVLNQYPNDGWDDPRELLSEAEADELSAVLAWSGRGSFLWPHCFDLAAFPEEDRARVLRLVDAAREGR